MSLHFVLNATKELENYGLHLYGSTHDPIFTQGYLRSKPNVSIIGSSCFIDYSQTYNTSDLTFLKKVFKNTPTGTTFAFSNGSYYDGEKDYITDVSGVMSFESITNNDKLVIGGIVSGFTYTTNYKFYYRENFTNTPQLTTGYKGGLTSSNYILNNITNNPAKSFINAGFIGSAFNKEEYVGLSGSTANSGKLKVNSVTVLKDNREILYTDVTLQNENSLTSNSFISQYIRGNANPEILSKSRKALGCYVIIDDNGNQVNCFENQNELQAFLRSQNEGATHSAYWVPCLMCSRISDNAFNAASADKSILFDAEVFLSVRETQIPSFSPSNDLVVNYTYSLYGNQNGTENLSPVNALSFTVDNGFKIDLSHPSLKGFEPKLYIDPQRTIEYSGTYYLIGTPGYDQSSLIYPKTATNPRLLYMALSGNVVFAITITVN
jgi:hypothetical protein